MIELRWLEYRDNVNPMTGEHFMQPSKYRKLQFRINKHSLHRALDGWTEWQDVPVVSE